MVEGTIELVAPFEVTGRNRHGTVLTLTPGTTEPSDVAVSYAWLRDGVPVAGAAGPTYAPTDADVGHALTAQVTMSKPRYRPFVQHPRAAGAPPRRARSRCSRRAARARRRCGCG